MKQDNKALEKRVVFPNEVVEGLTVESTLFNPINDDLAVSFLTEEQSGMHILRIYELRLQKDGVYGPVQELEAFSFMDRAELESFMEGFPAMNAIELLLVMNPTPGVVN